MTEALWKEALLWPVFVAGQYPRWLPAFEPKSQFPTSMRVIMGSILAIPVIGAYGGYRLASRSLAGFYVGGAIGTLATPGIQSFLEKKYGPGSHSSFDVKVKQDYPRAGPVHERGNLRPIEGYNKNPPLARYPFSQAHHFPLHQGFQSNMVMRGQY